ncbi:UNVERIFIED_CONTAM: hypothetical protein RMT77_007731 [Armadillidium vulgare]
MDNETLKWCDELGLKGEEATNFIKLHKFFDMNVDEQIQLCKELEMENDDAFELFLEIAEIRRRICKSCYDSLHEVSEREAAVEKIEMKYKLLKNELFSRIGDIPYPRIEVISTKKSRTPELVSLKNNVIEIEKQIISIQVFPTKGENSFSQPESSAEREEPSSQDLPILPTLPKWQRNEDEASSSSKALMKQDEREKSSVTSNFLSRSDNAFSKRLSNQSTISRKVCMEGNIEREVEYDRTPAPELGKMNTQETEKKDSSIRINISSKAESQTGRLRMRELKQESKSKVKCNMFDKKSIAEENEEGYEHNLPVMTSRDQSLFT